VLQASSDTSSTSTTVSSGALSVSQADGTSGQLLPLDISTFEAAFAANPSAVASIFQDSQQGLVQTLGSYLTTVTGLPTQTTTGLIGNIPSTSLIQSDENSNSAQIQSLQDYIKQINDEANAQADFLRAEFTSSEALIAQYQAVQGQIGQLSQSTS
jgi:flagellar capping protein FliD